MSDYFSDFFELDHLRSTIFQSAVEVPVEVSPPA